MKGLCYVGLRKTYSGWQRFAACHMKEEGQWDVVVSYGPLEQLDGEQAEHALSEMIVPARKEDLIGSLDAGYYACRSSFIRQKYTPPKSILRRAIDQSRLLTAGVYSLEELEMITTE